MWRDKPRGNEHTAYFTYLLYLSYSNVSNIFVLVVHLAIGFTAHMAPAALVCSLLYGRLRSLGIGIYDLVTMTYERLVLTMSMFSLCKAS